MPNCVFEKGRGAEQDRVAVMYRATMRRETANIASTIIVIVIASTWDPLLYFRDGIAALHNLAAKPRVSTTNISRVQIGVLSLWEKRFV